ncbi:nuclear factor of kappa light polypeptide gene enhancer in B-cells inhibitor, alpha a [Denticeps clupeoides]|uniref:NF-kappa-B inhibitor alpha n=1 Tax=Denticeps clupeoides TaxID=299321 RepID=A0AAY4D6U8_9TELE|nr:NF-kappa-B inhibitor alpha-like [Denticeps clupeoides]
MSRVDYCPDAAMDAKHRKTLPCADERLDSGLDSLKSGEYALLAEEMESLAVDDARTDVHGLEPWKQQVTEDGDTFLHLAIIHEAKEHAIKMIQQSQGDLFLNIQNYQRQTALHLAVITEQPELVERLVKAGCDTRLVDRNGNTALHVACKRGSMASFAVLTQVPSAQHLRSVLSFPNYHGHNCLHLASINGYLSMVEDLVQLGADINSKEQCSGRTALHLAVDLQNLSLVHRLISLGADVNSLTYGGFAPYHLTFGRQNSEIQQQLYEKTARDLRLLPESESEESDEDLPSDDEYDDIHFGGRLSPSH